MATKPTTKTKTATTSAAPKASTPRPQEKLKTENLDWYGLPETKRAYDRSDNAGKSKIISDRKSAEYTQKKTGNPIQRGSAYSRDAYKRGLEEKYKLINKQKDEEAKKARSTVKGKEMYGNNVKK